MWPEPAWPQQLHRSWWSSTSTLKCTNSHLTRCLINPLRQSNFHDQRYLTKKQRVHLPLVCFFLPSGGTSLFDVVSSATGAGGSEDKGVFKDSWISNGTRSNIHSCFKQTLSENHSWRNINSYILRHAYNL